MNSKNLIKFFIVLLLRGTYFFFYVYNDEDNVCQLFKTRCKCLVYIYMNDLHSSNNEDVDLIAGSREHSC